MRFSMATLGCKVNAYEGESYIEALQEAGYTLVDFKEESDLVIVNTCAVTNTAAAKSRQKIHQARKRNPGAILVVIGCMAQIQASPLDADIVIGSQYKNELLTLIDEYRQTNQRIVKIDDIAKKTEFEALPIKRFEGHTRAFLKIEDGCNQFCTYCIIPYARGRERSLKMDHALAIAMDLVKHGYKEIVLTGIHTGRYGRDQQCDLLTLLKAMAPIEGLERIRLSSIEINEISDELVDFIASCDKMAKHLHIPIQSACNRTLNMMNRPYTVEEYQERIEFIRAKIPRISISTDIILGFPDETEADYQETLKNLESLNFSFMHIFPYSKREGTKACMISNPVPNDVKKQRCFEVSLLSEKHYNEYKSTFLLQDVQALFEYEKDGYLFGHTSEYVPIMAKRSKGHINCLETVRIDSIRDGTLFSDEEE